MYWWGGWCNSDHKANLSLHLNLPTGIELGKITFKSQGGKTKVDGRWQKGGWGLGWSQKKDIIHEQPLIVLIRVKHNILFLL